MSFYSNTDAELAEYNQVKNDRKISRKNRKSTKQLAESQFNFSAKPISLRTFVHDAMDLAPDEPDLTMPITGNEEFAPMSFEPPIYPSNAEELAVEILDVAENFLKITDKAEIEVINVPSSNDINNVVEQVAVLTTASLMKNVDKNFQKVRIKTKKLTAKRFAFKALQLFSFNENYAKHFTMNVNELRNINTDMLIDDSHESVEWLKMLGSHYYDKYVTMLPQNIEPADELSLLNLLPKSNPLHKAIGFSVILKNCVLESLSQPLLSLSAIYQDLKNSPYEYYSFSTILDYFQIRLFGFNDGLSFQLNYLSLIPYYLKKSKDKQVYSLFSELDPFKKKKLV